MTGQVRKRLVANRQFKAEDSLLTILIENNSHVCTLHNIILAFVGIFSFATVADYVNHPEKFNRDLEVFLWNAADIPHFLRVWLPVNASIFLVLYPLIVARNFLQWKRVKHLKQKSVDLETIQKCQLKTEESVGFTLAYALYTITAIVALPTWYIMKRKISPAVIFALTMEMARLLMKVHSYFVETLPPSVDAKVLEKLNSTNLLSLRPKLSKLLYFLFAPTLIYRESYPRNDRIRWGFVIGHSVQMALTILISFIACCRFLIDVYSNTGFEKLTFKHLSRDLIMLGTILAFSCFYSFLHLWHNITAELLCFADRRYYQAWWESISLKEFYRKWNTLVQDWLFAYVYVPFKNFFNNTTIARFALIFVSGVVHEYIIVMSVGFIFPIQFLSFAIFGHVYFLLTENLPHTKAHNIIFLTMYLMGWGIIPTLYSIEWYSRINCPNMNPSWYDAFVPRMFTCVKL